jgi:vacuolar-type H+-ATPase subunit E/Vma4
MLRQATDAERDAMERLAQAERAAGEAREHLLEVIRRERERERLHTVASPDTEVGVGTGA